MILLCFAGSALVTRATVMHLPPAAARTVDGKALPEPLESRCCPAPRTLQGLSMQLFDQLTSRPKFIAFGLSVLVALWLLSGYLGKKPVEAQTAAEAVATAATMSVQFQAQVAQPVTRNLSIYGRTAPVRQVELKAETSGRVSELGVKRGALARQGELLLKLDLRDRQARLEQARAGVAQQEAAYKGQLELKPRGYVSDTQLAETLAKLETARG
ncbi:MAG: biotin/lipoyl-binding protein, partial [Gammaproteobacteria bacterium]|nr:biotin/lipoyl-binding protein [Gammaproteobacteria bacterium]